MKLCNNIFLNLAVLRALGLLLIPSHACDEPGCENFTGNIVKMCLFYNAPSGHARTDPILSQTCASDHVHTFYGPQNFHPDTTYEDIRDTDPQYSTTPFIENQSLYWHPSIYKVDTVSGTKTYTRISDLDSSPYYRWDNSVLPKTEAFPPGFRMIAYSNNNLFIECCDYVDEREQCTDSIGGMDFPTQSCDFVGIALAMPTCWNGNLGIDNDHISHMAYTDDGSVAGNCPSGYNRRLPEIQLFVRINNYQGGEYTLSDGSDVFHVDFMNGWQEGVLQKVIDECPIEGDESDGYNPPCECDFMLTKNENNVGAVCDSDTKAFIIDEATDVVSNLPRGSCQGPEIISKSWDINPPWQCTTSVDDDEAEDDDNEDTCEDGSLRFKITKNDGKKIMRDCTWVSNKNTVNRCTFDGVSEACRATCGAC